VRQARRPNPESNPPQSPRPADQPCLKAEALKLYDSFGLVPIPVNGKAALVKWKAYQRKRPRRATVQRWFATGRVNGREVTGVAVILGSVSGGVRVRDFDSAAAYRAWAKAFPRLAEKLPTVQTKRGVHVYFAADTPDVTVPVSGTPPRRAAKTGAKDGEFRGGGGYVVAPPSRHPDGGVYRWLIPPDPAGWPVLQDPAADGLSPPPAALAAAHRKKPARKNPVLPPSPNGVSLRGSACVACVNGPLPAEVVRAIKATLPTGPGQRNAKLFEFVGRLKALPLAWTPRERLAAIREWHRRALPVIRTKGFEETLTDFGCAWANRRHVHGADWEAAKRQALPGPCPPEADELGIADAALRRLMTLLAGLQRQAGAATFFLGCRDAGGAIGVCHMQASKLLNTLVGLGVLKRVKPGDPVPGGQAAEWRWLGSGG
jgi:hypothetical protein